MILVPELLFKSDLVAASDRLGLDSSGVEDCVALVIGVGVTFDVVVTDTVVVGSAVVVAEVVDVVVVVVDAALLLVVESNSNGKSPFRAIISVRLISF